MDSIHYEQEMQENSHKNVDYLFIMSNIAVIKLLDMNKIVGGMKQAMNAEVIADNLRAHRAMKRLSQQEVADAIHVHVNTLARWETGAGGIGIDKAWALADLFNCALDDLVGRKWSSNSNVK